MTAQLILEFEGATAEEYDAVNRELGIDMATGEGNWPDGLLVHSAGIDDKGDLVVSEVWDSPEHQARFMDGTLRGALERGGITGPPSRMVWVELLAHHRPGG